MAETTKKVYRRLDHQGAFRTAYDKNRKKVLASADVCYLCGLPLDKTIKDHSNPMFVEVDHIVPLKKGGHPSDLDNLAAVHKCCNRKKYDRLLSQMVTDETLTRTKVNDAIRVAVDWSNYGGSDLE